ncbi:MAG TPA: hypothetical protein VK524_29620 [Polyangiaceae bacterium]|nr:hypothetical protein [Polyangiaceae bacterium]
MDEQRQRSGRGRRRRRKARPNSRPVSEPILIAARRPNSPLLHNEKARPAASASAAPANGTSTEHLSQPRPSRPPEPAAPPRRSARIVQIAGSSSDEPEKERLRLLSRLLGSEGRGAISRAAEEYRRAGFEFPAEQAVQLQLLEHADEDQARQAISALSALLENEPPIKKPIFEQRLRRLEEYADEVATRSAAAALRRVIRA